MQNLTGRSFLRNITFISVVLSFFSTVSAQTLKRPNILWLSCEDISNHLGCYEEKHAITPTIDQFAQEGVRYTQAFTVHGVCAPSRSGIITGMYPSSLGTVNMRCTALKPDSIKCFTEYLRQAGYYCTNNPKEDYNFKTPKAAWDESGNEAHWKNRPTDKPFFAVFNFFPTHESQLWNSNDYDNTHPKRLKKSQWQKPENMTVPPIYPDTLAVRKDFARLFERITEFDYFVKDKINELKQAGLYEDTIIFIWSDHGNGLPRAKRWLYDSGTLVPLIVRIPERYRTTDQAIPGTADNQLVNLIDLGPTVLNLAGIKPPEHMQGQAFLGEQLPPRRKYIFGARQRIDELYDMVRSVRDKRYRYIRNFMPHVPYLPYLYYAENCNTMKAMRNLHAEGKLEDVPSQWMADSRPVEELYDLENDPWETCNLADDPSYSEIKQHLRKTLINWMIETRDTGLLPEPEMKQLAKQYGAEQQIFQQPGGEDRVRQLVELAITASSPTTSDRSQIEAALTSNDPAARKWAVWGMRAYPEATDTVQRAAKDESPSVRITAAWVLANTGQQAKAVMLLEKELKQHDQQDEVLHYAMNVLSLIGPEARSALPTVKSLENIERNNDYIDQLVQDFIKKYDTQGDNKT